MTAFITIYLMIGFYFLFLTYCYIEDNNITSFDILQSLKPKLGDYLSKHIALFAMFLLATSVGICVLWPYVLYIIYRMNKNGY